MGIEMKYVTLFVVLLVQGTDAATYVVGDSLGWTIPSGGAAAYTTWASKHTYVPGDILVFNYAAGIHDVATVTKASYDSCSSTSPLSLQTVSPANITLIAGTHYFICTFGQHCSLGQKLTVNVAASSSAPTASPPTATAMPPTVTATPPTAAAMPPTVVATPPTAAATPPTAVATPPTATPTMPPTAAMPPTVTPTMPPTAASPKEGAPAPSPSMEAGESPGASPPLAATPTGDSASPPAPSSATRKAVATLAIGFVFVVMGVTY